MNALILDTFPRVEFIAAAPQLRDLQQSSLWVALSAHQRHLAEVEPDAVLAWMVEGCLGWQRKGLRPPRCVVEATDDYFESEDALGRWIEERCFVERVARATAADLFEDWRTWAEKAGEFAGSIKRFSELLTNRRFERAKFSGGTRGFFGISLRPKPVSALPYRDD